MSVSADTPPTTAETIARLTRSRRSASTLEADFRLAGRLAITSFKLRYSSSALGYAWSLMRPLLIFGMLYLVFALWLLRGRTSPTENFPVELLVGIVAWTFFAEATSAATTAVAANADMLHRARFSRWVLVVAAVASATMTLAVNVTLVTGVGLAFHWFSIGWQTLWVPLLLLEFIALSVGLGLILSALFVYFRDLGYIWEIVLQFLFYASAIIVPLSLVPTSVLGLVLLNPVAQITEDLRRALVAGTIPWTVTVVGATFVVPLLIVACTLVAGFAVFARLSVRFGERL